jgi:hypothetical protein
MIKHFHRFSYCFILGLIIAGCNTTNKKSDTFDYISIASSPCYGRCPSYQLELRNDGFFTFHGSSYCQKIGSFKGKLTNEEMSKIERYFSHLTLKKDSTIFPTPMDLNEAVVQLKIHGHSYYFFGCPILFPNNLKKIEKELFTLAETSKLEKTKKILKFKANLPKPCERPTVYFLPPVVEE